MVWKLLNNHFFRRGLPFFSVLAISGYTYLTIVDTRINLKKRSQVIDSLVDFEVGQSRNVNRTRLQNEHPEVTEQLKGIRKAHKKLVKNKQDGTTDYDFKPVPKPSMWYK